jgi:hypothetical protein
MESAYSVPLVILGVFVLFFMVCGSLAGAAILLSGDLVMFSEVKGRVISEGKPVAGLQVVRDFTWTWR